MNISKDTKLTMVQAPIAAGSSDLASDYVDMKDFEGVRFCGVMGASTDTCTLAAWGATSTATTATTGSAISGATQTSTAGRANRIFNIDVFRPLERYVRAHLTRASTAGVWGGTIAEQYGPRVKPTINDPATAVSSGTPSVLVVPQTT